jgi:hypothetical protein
MGNKRRSSGHTEVENARQLFEQSRERGKPDFRFVALAIGSAPVRPPAWAIRACIEECEATELRSAALSPHVDVVLDEMIRVLDEHQQKGGDLRKKSVRSAILEATSRTSVCDAARGPLDDDQIRRIREAWDREQIEDRRHSVFPLEGYETTHRTDRVLTALYGEEWGMPADPVKALWRAENPSD